MMFLPFGALPLCLTNYVDACLWLLIIKSASLMTSKGLCCYTRESLFTD